MTTILKKICKTPTEVEEEEISQKILKKRNFTGFGIECNQIQFMKIISELG